MTTRKEAKQFLCEQLEKLHKEEDVDDLMKAGRLDELYEIAEELDFSGLEEFFEEYDKFFLEIEEIPEGCHYELLFYFSSQANWDDEEIFDDYEEVIEFLEKIEEDLAQNAVKLLENNNLRQLSLEELLFEEYDEGEV